MINRFLKEIRILNDDYTFSCRCRIVCFEGLQLEPEKKLKLISLGYYPAIDIWNDKKYEYMPLGIGSTKLNLDFYRGNLTKRIFE